MFPAADSSRISWNNLRSRVSQLENLHHHPPSYFASSADSRLIRRIAVCLRSFPATPYLLCQQLTIMISHSNDPMRKSWRNWISGWKAIQFYNVIAEYFISEESDTGNFKFMPYSTITSYLYSRPTHHAALRGLYVVSPSHFRHNAQHIVDSCKDSLRFLLLQLSYWSTIADGPCFWHQVQSCQTRCEASYSSGLCSSECREGTQVGLGPFKRNDQRSCIHEMQRWAHMSTRQIWWESYAKQSFSSHP